MKYTIHLTQEAKRKIESQLDTFKTSYPNLIWEILSKRSGLLSAQSGETSCVEEISMLKSLPEVEYIEPVREKQSL